MLVMGAAPSAPKALVRLAARASFFGDDVADQQNRAPLWQRGCVWPAKVGRSTSSLACVR
jgi:hypothetical protein